jgi:hypothetical protein
MDPGVVNNGLYRNKGFSFSYAIPAGWVLRTEEMNSRQDEGLPAGQDSESQSAAGSRVLLAAFSRPPEAAGQEVNSSILIAAESVSEYPGLTEAAQYFGPLTEVAKAQGLIVDEEPYEVEMGTKKLVRSDYHKDVGTRVMRQSTLAFVARGYAVSITVIAGTEDELEDLMNGLNFASSRTPAPK